MGPHVASEHGPVNAVQAAEVRRREIVLLLILASVQFTSIVDFMVVMPLGPQLMDKLAINPAQFSWIVASYTVAAGLAGLLGSAIMDRFGRKSAYLTLYAGFLVGTLCCGLSSSTSRSSCAANYRRFRRHSLGVVAGDHRRRVSRRAARACHRHLDVGVCGGVGGRRACRHSAGQPVWLAGPVPNPGGAGFAGLFHQPARPSLRCANTSGRPTMFLPWPSSSTRSVNRTICAHSR